jgi:hypothetical protein
MRIEIDLKGNIKTGDITKTAKKDVWSRLKEKKVASMTAGNIASFTWDMIDTTIISNIGSMANDVTVQNKIDNTISLLNRGGRLINAAIVGSAAGLPGAAVAVVSEMINQGLQAYQSNTNWKIQALENKMKSIVQLESLGFSKTDLNR